MSTADFVRESNKIEGILREPTQAEIQEHDRFVGLYEVTLEDLERFVHVYQPGARLRSKTGLDVIIGNHLPEPGGPRVVGLLHDLLSRVNRCEDTPYRIHVDYETLHPFTDGNGRSGRVLWAWQMRRLHDGCPLGFLHHFYYQSLAESKDR